MLTTALWLTLSMLGFLVASGVAADSWWFYQRFRKENASLASSYLREVVGDIVIQVSLGFCAFAGLLALTRPFGGVLAGILLTAVFFGIPVALTGLSLYKYWRRRHRRRG